MSKADAADKRLILRQILSRYSPFLILFFSIFHFLVVHHTLQTALRTETDPTNKEQSAASRRPLPANSEIELPSHLGKNNSSSTTKPLVQDRVFLPWFANRTLPCYPPTDENSTMSWTHRKNLKRPTDKGLFFLKLLKTGSTTGSSIHVRIAHNLARRLHKSYQVCRTRHLHGWAGPRMYQFGKRVREESFLWTLVREPTSRYISEFFHFEVSRMGKEATDENAIDFLRNGKHSDRHYLSWLTTQRYRKATVCYCESNHARLRFYWSFGTYG